ncbi:MAG: response regulator [Candidatus Aureabacteria bacterium]|nr:response regulator [Candidatus Auribacterota bacterium]
MQKKQRIVVVDGDARPLEQVLRSAGFEVVAARSEEEIFQTARHFSPSLIIGDFKTEGMNVLRFCKRVKRDYILHYTPIIIVTKQGEIREKIEAVNGGADDYIVSPFHDEELLARIKRAILANENALNANPLTKLPGNISVKNEIQRRIACGEDFAVYYLDIDNFKVFNDCYGYERGDEAITFTARTLLSAMKKNENQRECDFVGHIGGDDFVMLSAPKKVDALCRDVIEQFDAGVPQLYDQVDRERRFLIGRDRKGRTNIYPFMTISLAVTISQGERRFRHFAEVSQKSAEIKKYLKQYRKSIYMVDRRN